MISRSSKKKIVYFYWLSIGTFPIFASLGEWIDSGLITTVILYRFIILSLSIYLFIEYFSFSKVVKHNKVFIVYLLFWMIYIFRLVFYLYLDPSTISLTFKLAKSQYLLLAIGSSFIPSIIFFIDINSRTMVEISRFLRITFPIVLLILLFTGLNYLSSGVTWRTGQIHSSSLNYILYGQYAASATLFYIYEIFKKKYKSKFQLIMLILGTLFALFILFFSGSRGAILAFFGSFILLFTTQFKIRNSITVLIIFLFLSYIVFPELISIFNLTFFDRFHELVSGGELSSSIRIFYYKLAIDKFLEYPFLGGALEIKYYNIMQYPHNVVLESFMATGIIGGLLFISILFISIKRSFQLLKRAKDFSWVGLFAVQFIIGGLFSGSLYSNTFMWWFIAATLKIWYFSKEEKYLNTIIKSKG